MSGPARRRLTCRLCTRRKVKCDKQIPCNNCIRRGTTADCERDDVDELRAPSSPGPFQRQPGDPSTVAALRARVDELEAALQQKNTASSIARSPSPATEQAVGTASSPTPREGSHIEDAVTVLEFLAWGRMKDPDKAILSPEALRVSERDDGVALSPPDVDNCDLDPCFNLLSWLQILLPSRRQVYQLVGYHNNCILWFHCSYLASTFGTELDAFYAAHDGMLDSAGLTLEWVALLFSVMAGTIISAPAHEARKWGFEESESKLLSQKWYKAVKVSLNAANFTARHSLHAIQAITTLTNTAHILGHSDAQSVMLASAVRIAQSLGLHRLDEDARGTNIELETGRRVWQELCTQDWFSTAFSESYLINPLHSTALTPMNCDDDMNVLVEDEPTIVSFCRFLAKIAAIMPSLQDAMALSNTLYTKHEVVLTHDKKMRSLATGRPSFLANTAFERKWPCYIPWARRAIAMSSAHKIIMIHRKFLGLSFTNPVFGFTRRTCLAASKTILKEYLAGSVEESSPMLWTHQAFAVAACIIICFDRIHSSSSSQDELELVEQSLGHLQWCRQKSMIAARGVKVLNALQKQIASRAESRKRPADTTTDPDSSKRRRRGFDAVEFARSFCDDRDGPPLPGQRLSERPSPSCECDYRPRSQAADEDLQPVGNDEPLTFPADLNWLWNSPLNNGEYSDKFDSLLSFANQGRVGI